MTATTGLAGAKAEDRVLAGLDDEGDRQSFRSLLRRVAMHADVADAGREACTIGQRQVSPDGSDQGTAG
jgi:hypothetical protein